MSDCSWVWAGRHAGLFMQKATHEDGRMRWHPHETEAMVTNLREHPYGLDWALGHDWEPQIGLRWHTRTAAWADERPGLIRLETGLAAPHTIALPETPRGSRRMARTMQVLIAGHIHDGLFPDDADRRPRTVREDAPAPAVRLRIHEREGATDPFDCGTLRLSRSGGLRLRRHIRAGMLERIAEAPAGVTLVWGGQYWRDAGMRADLFRVRTGHLGHNLAAVTWELRAGTFHAYVPDTPAGRPRLARAITRMTARLLRTWERALAQAKARHWDTPRDDEDGGEG